MGRAAKAPATTGEAPGEQERPRMGRPPRPGGPLRNQISLKGTPEWYAWLCELAGHLGTDPAVVLEQGAAALARRAKFRKPPPRT